MDLNSSRLILYEYTCLALSLILVAITYFFGHLSINVTAASFSMLLAILSLILLSCYFFELRITYPWKFRSNSSNGLWLTVLIPLSLFIECHLKGVSFSCIHAIVYDCLLMKITSLNLFISSIFFCFHRSSRSSSILPYFLLLSLPGSVFVQQYTQFDWISSLLLSFIGQGVFIFVAEYFTSSFSSNFTLGEVLLLSQGTSIFVVASLHHLTTKLLYSNTVSLHAAEVTLFAEVLLLACCLVVLITNFFPKFRSFNSFFGLFLIVGFTFVYPVSCLIFGGDLLVWLFSFICNSTQRLTLLVTWFLLLTLAIIIVFAHSLLISKTTTIIRKYFHFLLVLVYIPGLLFDISFLFLSTIIVFGLFILLECIRYFNIEPISTVINNHFHFFFDEKDKGYLVLSHFYLLIGCSLPIWIHPSGTNLASFSGLISVGIGDSMASICGVLFGRHRWPGSNKTFEGTASSICAQFLFSIILEFSGVFGSEARLLLLVIIVITSLLEAFTSQIDNIVVPLLFHCLSTILI